VGAGVEEFFFEKKNQKRLCALSRTFLESAGQRRESFLLLFFKKEGLLSLPTSGC
jgi:hypothetical protein